MRRLFTLLPLLLVLGCDLVVGIEDVRLAEEGEGGNGGAASIATTSTGDAASGTTSGIAGTPLCGLTSDAFDTLDASRWSLVAGQAAVKSGELALRLQGDESLAALRTLATPVVDATPCAVWVTVLDAPQGIDLGLSIPLPSGAELSLFRTGRTITSGAGTTVDGPAGKVTLRIRFEPSPARVVYEYATGPSTSFAIMGEHPLMEPAVTGVMIFARRVPDSSTSTARFDSFAL